MSLGHCRCPCGDWNHDGSACTGGADEGLPVSRTQEGNTAQPVCAYCYAEIKKISDQHIVAPRRPQ